MQTAYWFRKELLQSYKGYIGNVTIKEEGRFT